MKSLETRLDAVRNHPLHRSMGLQRLVAAEGRAHLSVDIAGEGTLNPAGMMHGGVLYVLCDVAAYAATLSLLEAEQEAVTHDLHLSVLRGGGPGMRIEIEANVIKRGRQLAFIQVQATHGGQPMATATITKSILQPR